MVCRQCGYAFYGKMARGLVGGRAGLDAGGVVLDLLLTRAAAGLRRGRLGARYH